MPKYIGYYPTGTANSSVTDSEGSVDKKYNSGIWSTAQVYKRKTTNNWLSSLNTRVSGTLPAVDVLLVGGGGGGGASGSAGNNGGGAGSDGTTGNGGDGTASAISGSSVTYGGGGGGGTGGGGTGDPGNGGAGGGGDGSNSSTFGSPGTDGLGGGGGGGGNNGGVVGYGGDGGSGVVIIRYQSDEVLATGGTVTTSNGYQIHTFTSSDTFAFGVSSFFAP